MASGLLGQKCNDTFFKIVAVVVTVVVLLFWFVVTFKCLVGAIDGTLFFVESPRGQSPGKINGSRVTETNCKRSAPSDASTKAYSEV